MTGKQPNQSVLLPALIREVDRAVTPEYRVRVTIRNNLLLQRIADAGYRSVNQLCAMAGLDYGRVLGLLSFRIKPRSQHGEWTPLALALASALRAEPEDLWTEPEDLWTEKQQNLRTHGGRELEVCEDDLARALAFSRDPEQILQIAEQRRGIEMAMSKLRPREQTMLRMYYGLDGVEYTMKEIATQFGVCTQRVRDIIRRARERLRPELLGLD